MSIRVTLHNDPSAFDALADEWTALLRRSPNDVFFLTPAYQHAWWRNLGRGQLGLLAARAEGELVGVAPLFVLDDVLRVVGCFEVSDYLDWVTLAGQEEAVLAAFVEFIDSAAAPFWHALDLCNVHEGSPTLRLLPELARARGWQVQTEVQEVCPVVSLPATWDDYLAALGRKDRHELRRKLRRAESDPDVAWYFVQPDDDLSQAAEDFLVLMAKSHADKEAFLTPQMRQFFRDLIHIAADRRWLSLSFLTFRGRKLATYLNFRYNNRILSYNSGLDWENDPRLGAGAVLTGYLIRHAIEQGHAAYDFMRGDEPYKYRYGGQDVSVNRIFIVRRR